MFKMNKIFLSFCFLTTTLLAFKAFSYSYVTLGGETVKWENNETDTLYIDEDSIPEDSDEGKILVEMMREWERVGGSDFDFHYSFEENSDGMAVFGDWKSEVIFVSGDTIASLGMNSGTLGFAVPWVSGNHYSAVDIIFNRDAFPSGFIEYEEYDLFYETALHELGHALGLQHTDDYGYMGYGNAIHEGEKFVLPVADDRQGIRYLYPDPDEEETDVLVSSYEAENIVYVEAADTLLLGDDGYLFAFDAINVPNLYAEDGLALCPQDEFTIRRTLINNGSREEEITVVYVFDPYTDEDATDDIVVKTSNPFSIASGIATTTDVDLSVPLGVTPAGRYQVEITIDPDNELSEEDETNNKDLIGFVDIKNFEECSAHLWTLDQRLGHLQHVPYQGNPTENGADFLFDEEGDADSGVTSDENVLSKGEPFQSNSNDITDSGTENSGDVDSEVADTSDDDGVSADFDLSDSDLPAIYPGMESDGSNEPDSDGEVYTDTSDNQEAIPSIHPGSSGNSGLDDDGESLDYSSSSENENTSIHPESSETPDQDNSDSTEAPVDSNAIDAEESSAVSEDEETTDIEDAILEDTSSEIATTEEEDLSTTSSDDTHLNNETTKSTDENQILNQESSGCSLNPKRDPSSRGIGLLLIPLAGLYFIRFKKSFQQEDLKMLKKLSLIGLFCITGLSNAFASSFLDHPIQSGKANFVSIFHQTTGIYRGEVKKVETRRGTDGRTPYTYITFKIEEALKGKNQAGEEIVIRQAGGRIGTQEGGEGLFIPGTISLYTGDRLILFLGRNNHDLIPFARGEAGVLRIAHDANYGEFITTFDGLRIMDKGGDDFLLGSHWEDQEVTERRKKDSMQQISSKKSEARNNVSLQEEPPMPKNEFLRTLKESLQKNGPYEEIKYQEKEAGPIVIQAAPRN